MDHHPPAWTAIECRTTDSLPQHIFYKYNSPQQCDGAWFIAASSPPPFTLTSSIQSPSPVAPVARLFTTWPLFHRLPTHNFPLNTTRCPTSCTYHADFNRILYIWVRQLLASYIYHSSSHLRVLLYNVHPLLPSYFWRVQAFPRQKFRSVWSSTVRQMPHLS
jgi:hypothetical protein